jgi:hypothetical protein
MRSECAWLNEWTGFACTEVLASDPPSWKRHEPVSVQMQITVARPPGHFTASGQLNATGRKYPAPTRQGDGDEDKHRRAVYDMLVMAGVLADDADVSSPGPASWMQWCGPYVVPGVLITISDFSSTVPEPRHLATWAAASGGDVLIACNLQGREWPLATVRGIVTSEKHQVTCAKCRELLNMSKGVR